MIIFVFQNSTAKFSFVKIQLRRAYVISGVIVCIASKTVLEVLKTGFIVDFTFPVWLRRGRDAALNDHRHLLLLLVSSCGVGGVVALVVFLRSITLLVLIFIECRRSCDVRRHISFVLLAIFLVFASGGAVAV